MASRVRRYWTSHPDVQYKWPHVDDHMCAVVINLRDDPSDSSDAKDWLKLLYNITKYYNKKTHIFKKKQIPSKKKDVWINKRNNIER